MSGVKKLAGQTLWYGVPTIARRFLGYLMNLSLPLLFAQPEATADLTQIYAIIPFLSVLFTYGLETAYFRFSRDIDQQKLYSTLTLSLIGTTVLFTALLFLFRGELVSLAKVEANPWFIDWMIAIVFLDTLSTLAFAKLRQENRPKKYALVTLAGVCINVAVVLLFLGFIPAYTEKNPHSFLGTFYDSSIGIGYYLIGNFIGSLVTFLLLQKEFFQIRLQFDKKLMKTVLLYSFPLIIVGLGGMINDMMSRLIYQHVVDLPEEQAKHELGIFGNIFRIAVLITILIQAFRMAAEPFFFQQSKEENAPKTYARVMKFFVIACCFMFLFISLYIDVVAWFFQSINRAQWVEGLHIVPLLALGNIFLGIYYNLSIWYKLTDKNRMGAYITLGGAVITILLNIVLIPWLHYLGAAIATFVCYLYMMIASYKLGQKHYPIPYVRKKLTAYVVIVILLYLIHRGMVYLWDNKIYNLVIASLLLLFFTWLIINVEKKELIKIPLLRKVLRLKP